ncbi:hypothetical protein AHMF7605_21665 [Adhaeribacter arboris]|uniref:Uncharacterized protein n=1 Tax=Adhaeribacter arboris TaxID=2072846 RepID=A0A2T2YK92_9BACT|nr:hypothetical protein [Adhaeribacter arboris]PSR55922.1 hypothetical protein AHMF7605_21665 [Adhaeribacter arboris]
MDNLNFSLVEDFNTCYPEVELTFTVQEAKLPDPQQELVCFSYYKQETLQHQQYLLTKWCFIEHSESFVIAAVKRDLGLPS